MHFLCHSFKEYPPVPGQYPGRLYGCPDRHRPETGIFARVACFTLGISPSPAGWRPCRRYEQRKRPCIQGLSLRCHDDHGFFTGDGSYRCCADGVLGSQPDYAGRGIRHFLIVKTIYEKGAARRSTPHQGDEIFSGASGR